MLLILLVSIVATHSFDVSFIPNDENAPLPLSSKYRASLRKLCVLLSNNAALPDTLAKGTVKRRSLQSMCAKLQKVRSLNRIDPLALLSYSIIPLKDDDNIAVGTSNPFASLLSGSKGLVKLIITVATIGGGYILWQNHKAVLTAFRKLFIKSRGVKLGGTSWEDRNEGIAVIDSMVKDEVVDYALEESNRLMKEARQARLRRFEQMSESVTSDEN